VQNLIYLLQILIKTSNYIKIMYIILFSQFNFLNNYNNKMLREIPVTR